MSRPLPGNSITDAISLTGAFQEEAARRLGSLCLGLAVVLECLRKQPQDRPGSAEALYRALDRCDLHQPWSEESARQWWETNAPEAM